MNTRTNPGDVIRICIDANGESFPAVVGCHPMVVKEIVNDKAHTTSGGVFRSWIKVECPESGVLAMLSKEQRRARRKILGLHECEDCKFYHEKKVVPFRPQWLETCRRFPKEQDVRRGHWCGEYQYKPTEEEIADGKRLKLEWERNQLVSLKGLISPISPEDFVAMGKIEAKKSLFKRLKELIKTHR